MHGLVFHDVLGNVYSVPPIEWNSLSTDRFIPSGSEIIGLKADIRRRTAAIQNLSFVTWSPPESSMTQFEQEELEKDK